MSMNDHVDLFNKIWVDLLNLDEKFKDEDKALLLLNSLSEEYDYLTTTLLHGKDSVIYAVYCITLEKEKQKGSQKYNCRSIFSKRSFTKS